MHSSLNAELARQRIADRVAEAHHQRLVRLARRHTRNSHAPSRSVLVTLARRIGLARWPVHATS